MRRLSLARRVVRVREQIRHERAIHVERTRAVLVRDDHIEQSGHRLDVRARVGLRAALADQQEIAVGHRATPGRGSLPDVHA